MHDESSNKVKILIVDDLPEKLLVYRTVLNSPDLQIVEARSGHDALRHLLNDEFAVILLDVNMPGMDGFETAALIRARKRCSHTPIIFVTAYADEIYASKGYAYGAVDFILSPIVPTVLQTKVRVFVELFRLNQQVRAHAERTEEERVRLTAVLESAPDFVGRIDSDGRMLSINRAGRRMLGLGVTDPLPATLAECSPRSASEEGLRSALQVAAREGVWFGESVLNGRHGAEIPVSQVILCHKRGASEVDSFSIIARDIADRRRAEHALSESERRYRLLVQSLPAAVYTCDQDGRVILYNDAAVELWGRTPDVGKDLWCGSWRIFRPDGTSMPVEECPMARTLKEGRAVRGEEIIIERPDGTRRNVLPHPEPVLDASGAVVGAVNMLMDITDLKEANRARGHLAAIVESTEDAIISKSLDGVITAMNKAAERLFGYSASELVGRSVTQLIPTERQDEERVILDRIRQGLHIESFETIRMTKDGRRIDVSLSISPVRDVQGRMVGASKIARDITQRKRAERALRQSEGRLRAMFGQAAVGIVLADRQGRFIEVNDRMCQIVGRSAAELCTLTCQDLTHPDDWTEQDLRLVDTAASSTVAGADKLSLERRYRCGDGSWVWVNVTVTPLVEEETGAVERLIAIVEDISARKTAEQDVQQYREHLEQLEASHERLRMAERLASIGTLAAGLGHDIGNLLLPVRLRLDLLDHLHLPKAAKEHVQAIATCAEYLKKLSQGLRLFAIDPDDDGAIEGVTHLQAWWQEVEPFLRNALPRSITLEASLPESLPPITMPAHRLTQAMFNLVQNAGDALRDRSNGLVRIDAEVSADEQQLVLTVADNGPGMSDETRQRCLEPFFTTKTRGLSTGLGLALVRGAVVKAGGSITIDSHAGRGTAIHLVIPTVKRNADDSDTVGVAMSGYACVKLNDARLAAYVTSILRMLEIDVRTAGDASDPRFGLLVTTAENGQAREIQEFLHGGSARRALVFGRMPDQYPTDRVMCIGAGSAPAHIREALMSIVGQSNDALEEAPA
jgi:PAS domain S-box-containing protein